MDISNAWGYGAVVFPRKMIWQAFIILDPGSEPIRAAVGRALANAEQVASETTRVEGVLASALVECLERGNEFGIGVFASALSHVMEKRFWVVDTHESEDGDGRVTRCSPLDATTPEAAREEIERRVLPLKMGQLLQAMTKDAKKESPTEVDPGEPAHPHDDDPREPKPSR